MRATFESIVVQIIDFELIQMTFEVQPFGDTLQERSPFNLLIFFTMCCWTLKVPRGYMRINTQTTELRTMTSIEIIEKIPERTVIHFYSLGGETGHSRVRSFSLTVSRGFIFASWLMSCTV